MEKVVLNDLDYKILKNERECFIIEETLELMTDYFNEFDYILGDYSYGKLRLKGFYEATSKKVKDLNNIDNINDYLENFCATGCRHFILQKIT